MSVALAGPGQSLIAWYIRSTLNGAERCLESTVDSCVMKLCDGGSLCSLPPSEAHRAPDIVDGDLADALDVLLEQMSPEDVPIQVRAELSRLWICDPSQTVRLRDVHDRPRILSTSATVLTKTRIASACADDVTTTSSRSMPAGFPTTRTFIPSFRFSFCASLIQPPPRTHFVAQAFAFVCPSSA